MRTRHRVLAVRKSSVWQIRKKWCSMDAHEDICISDATTVYASDIVSCVALCV